MDTPQKPPVIIHDTFVELISFIEGPSLRGKPFSRIVDSVSQNSRFSRVRDPDASRAYFDFSSAAGYGLLVESLGCAVDRSLRPAKFELQYYRKHPVRSREGLGFGSDFPPNDLERIFTAAANHGLDIDIVGAVLDGIGLSREGLLFSYKGGILLSSPDQESQYDAFLGVVLRLLPKGRGRSLPEVDISARLTPTLP